MGVQHELAAWKQGRDGLMALAQVDVRAMRRINLAFGLEQGDALLSALEDSLCAWLGDRGCIVRSWGAEFSLLLPVDSPMEAVDVANDMMEALQASEAVREAFPVTFAALNRYAVGVVVMRADEAVDGALLAAIDACAEAKRRGSSEVVFHTPDQRLRGGLGEQLHHLRALEQCLSEGALEIHAQPIVNLQAAGYPIVKAEVLARLHPRDDFGKAPQHLLETAQAMGVMPDVDRYVVQHAIDALGAHPEIVQSLECVSINLSAQSLMDAPTMRAIFGMVTRSGIAPNKLAFEITETDALTYIDQTRDKIENLRRLGCRLVLDDFGVGYCSFGYLSRLPVDEVKIDGLFIREIDERAENELIIRAIHNVATATGKRTTAEFIENHTVAARLRDIGIDYGQGWGFHPAMTLVEMQKLL